MPVLSPSRPSFASQVFSRDEGVTKPHHWIVTICILGGLWIFAHPYRGLIHDAQLYGVQVLRVLEPGVYGRDLNFAFGSQDDYSLFTALFAPLARAIGLSNSALLITALGHLFWFSGVFLLARRLFENRYCIAIALVFAVTLPADYGGFGILSYAEGFATPRVFAEAATLWALWLATNHRPLPAFAVIVAAAALHPLYGAIGFAAVVCLLGIRGDWRWFLLPAICLPLGLAAAFVGVPPFDALLARYDSAWFEVVRLRNPMVLLGEWKDRDWGRLIMGAALVGVGATIGTAAWRRMALAVLLTAAGGMAVTLLGADLANNVLITQLQLFRATWLLALFAHLALGVLLYELWRQRTNASALTAVVAAGLLLVWLFPWFGLPVGLTGVVLGGLQVKRSLPQCSRVIDGIAFALLALVLFFYLPARVMDAREAVAYFQAHALPWTELLTDPVLTESLIVAALAVGLFFATRQGKGPTAVAMVAIFTILAATVWDRRSEYRIEIDSGGAPPSLRQQVPETASVFFEGESDLLWFYLGRRAYLTRLHGSSVLFFRPLALAYAERAEMLEPLEVPYLLRFRGYASRKDLELPDIDREALIVACRNAQELDFMLLHRRVKGLYEGRWVLHRVSDDGDAADVVRNPANVVYLYDCSRLRN